MDADERMWRLIQRSSGESLRVLAAWLWEGLKRRMVTNERADEWADAAERVIGRAA